MVELLNRISPLLRDLDLGYVGFGYSPNHWIRPLAILLEINLGYGFTFEISETSDGLFAVYHQESNDYYRLFGENGCYVDAFTFSDAIGVALLWPKQLIEDYLLTDEDLNPNQPDLSWWPEWDGEF